MTCDQCFESLSAQLDGELTGADQQAMELHLESCHYCQSMRDRLFDLSGQLKTQAFPPASPETAAQLSKVALERCSAFAFAPQVGKVGSLNVAAATAIALYEARRQEWTAAPPSPG